MQQLAALTPSLPSTTVLSRRHKAAVVVRLILSEGLDIKLQDLPEDLQSELTRAMGDLRGIDRDTLEQVVEEFTSELDRLALTFPPGLDGAISVLGDHLSPNAVSTLRSGRSGPSPWDRLRDTEPEVLAQIVEEESIEVTAVLLSKLPVKKAAALLGLMPGARSRRVAFAVSKTENIRPEAVLRIGEALALALDMTKEPAFETPPAPRVGAILNSTRAATREEVLSGLQEEDEIFASEVRKAIFTFSDIRNRVDPKDVAKLMKVVNQDELVKAISAAQATEGAEAVVAEFILENLSQRMAGQIRDQVSDFSGIDPEEGEADMQVISEAIRDLADQGEIKLIEPGEKSDG